MTWGKNPEFVIAFGRGFLRDSMTSRRYCSVYYLAVFSMTSRTIPLDLKNKAIILCLTDRDFLTATVVSLPKNVIFKLSFRIIVVMSLHLATLYLWILYQIISMIITFFANPIYKLEQRKKIWFNVYNVIIEFIQMYYTEFKN